MILIFYEKKNHYQQIYYHKSNKSSRRGIIQKGTYDIKLNDEIKILIDNYKSNRHSFEEKLKMGYKYPKYPNHKYGDKFLLYVRTYLLSKRHHIKAGIYPQYINEASEDQQPNLKSYFRRVARNYDLDIYKNLYFKHYYRTKENEKLDATKIQEKNIMILFYVKYPLFLIYMNIY